MMNCPLTALGLPPENTPPSSSRVSKRDLCALKPRQLFSEDQKDWCVANAVVDCFRFFDKAVDSNLYTQVHKTRNENPDVRFIEFFNTHGISLEYKGNIFSISSPVCVQNNLNNGFIILEHPQKTSGDGHCLFVGTEHGECYTFDGEMNGEMNGEKQKLGFSDILYKHFSNENSPKEIFLVLNLIEKN